MTPHCIDLETQTAPVGICEFYGQAPWLSQWRLFCLLEIK
jgi:hypothetical protein